MKPDREEVLRVAGDTGVLGGYEGEPEYLERFAAHFFEAGARAEREECAKICAIRSADRAFISDCLKHNKPMPTVAVVESGRALEAAECADAIRARTTP